MKASLFLAVTGAALAVASPIAGLEKRAMHTDWVVEVKTVTVTEGNIPVEPTQAPKPKVKKPPVVLNPERPEPTKVKTQPKPKPTKAPPKQYPPPQEPPKQEPPKQEPPKEEPEPPKENPSSGAGEYADLMLKHHNLHRANHSASALVWDEKLEEAAKMLGTTCVFDHDTSLGIGGYGQNLASAGSTGDISSLKMQKAAEAVTEQWYNGEFAAFAPLYGVESPSDVSDLMQWGHFSALLWKGTKKLGCATVECPSGTVLGGMAGWYTVCNYSPAGNMGGAFAENVGEPKGDQTLTV